MSNLSAFPVSTAATSMRSRWAYLLLALMFTSTLFYLGGQPFAGKLFPVPLDKFAHFLAFSVLAALLFRGTAGRMPLRVIAIVAAIGALDEWHQAGLPGRSASIYDFLTDVGAAVAVVAFLNLRRRSRTQPAIGSENAD